jgi:thiamine-monophosphate kinase
MNEAEFVQYLKTAFPFSRGLGIGDDASAVQTGGVYQLVTKDILIEDVHFRLCDFTMEELALKSLAVNLSDIAAMGGTPRYFYLGLGFPRQLPRERCMEFFKGLETGCRKWNVELAGGDFSGSAAMFISVTVIGEARRPVYRHNAQTGDLIGITGVTGESAIGLRLLLQGTKNGYFQDRHRQVAPGIEKGRVLASYVNAMIDLSDGLAIDLERVLTASKKGARLAYENIPVTPQIQEICRRESWNPYEIVLGGGEDYVLLFTISREKETLLKKEHSDLEYYIIGEINGSAGSLIIEDRGRPVTIAHAGYDHFEFSPGSP